MMNRREVLAGVGAVALAGCGQTDQAPGAPVGPAVVVPGDDPFVGASLMKDVEAYVGFGTHRTGSSGDVQTSEWFAKRWRDLGYAVEQNEFPVPNAETTTAKFEVAGETFEAFAQPPLVFSEPGGIQAPMAYWNPASAGDVRERVAVVNLPRAAGAPSPGAAYREAFERCRNAGALGIVAVVSSPSGEVTAINTPVDMLMEIPVLMVGEKDKARVNAAIAKRQPAKMTVEGPGGFRNGKNTVARRGTSGKWVIVSTPQSGWFTCGGERGPGIAMSLALSKWAAQRDFPVRFLFVATSGHEWTDFGAHLFHEAIAPDPKDTMLWFHLGASFGARAYQEAPGGLQALDTPNATRTLMASEDMLASCRTAFAGQVGIEQPATADISKALGEYRLVLGEGYPSSAGFWGANAKFHTPIDGADSTTGAIMEPVARAVAKVIEERIARG
jgi:hypothetical protein